MAVALIIVLLIYAYSADAVSSKFTEYRIKKIAKDYYDVHSYSSNDFFACLDMTIDLWNIYKTAGYNTKIALGNLQKANASMEEINHAWLIVEIAPFKWIAVETTTGRVIKVWQNNNGAYYSSSFLFRTPAHVKKYIELRDIYFKKLNELGRISESECAVYRKNIIEYNKLVASYLVEQTKRDIGLDYDRSIVQSIIYVMDALKKEINGIKEHCENEDAEYARGLKELDDISEKLALLML